MRRKYLNKKRQADKNLFFQLEKQTSTPISTYQQYRNRSNLSLSFPLSFVLLFSMIRGAMATLVSFNATGNQYIIGVDTSNSASDWRLPILQKIKDSLAGGVCGNVTLLDYLQGSAWPVWEQTICSSTFFFDRFSREAMQLFENCTIESIIKPAIQYDKDTCEKVNNDILIVFGIVFGTIFTLVICFCICMCVATGCCDRPESPPIASIPQAFRMWNRPKVTESNVNLDIATEETPIVPPAAPNASV